jgi:hypothetical protein
MINKAIIKRFWPLFLSIIILTVGVFLYLNPLVKLNSAGLQVEYTGPDQYASVFLNNQYLEKAPLSEKNIQSGDYVLKIVPDDQTLAEFSTPITLTEGALTVVTYNPGPDTRQSSATIYEVEPQSDLKELGTVSFETYPENALLSFDQAPTQYTPVTIDALLPKEYSYSVSLPSYEMQENKLQVLAGHQIKITIKLAKLLTDKLSTEQSSNNTGLNQESTGSAELIVSSEATENQTDLKDESWGAEEINQISGKKVRIKNTNFFIDGQEVLRVREEPSITAKELGFAKSNYYYPYIENLGSSSNTNQSDEWLKIKFQNQDAWVSANFAEIIAD